MSHCQPLVILENIRKTGAMPLCQWAARASGAQGRGIKFLTKPYLKTRGEEGKFDDYMTDIHNARNVYLKKFGVFQPKGHWLDKIHQFSTVASYNYVITLRECDCNFSGVFFSDM